MNELTAGAATGSPTARRHRRRDTRPPARARARHACRTATRWPSRSRCVAASAAGDADDELLLLEHPPVYTLGRGADAADLRGAPERLGVPVYRVGRGGGATFHGPGTARRLSDRPPARRRARRPSLRARPRSGAHRHLRALRRDAPVAPPGPDRGLGRRAQDRRDRHRRAARRRLPRHRAQRQHGSRRTSRTSCRVARRAWR